MALAGFGGPGNGVAGVNPEFIGQEGHGLFSSVFTLGSQSDLPRLSCVSRLRKEQNQNRWYQHPAQAVWDRDAFHWNSLDWMFGENRLRRAYFVPLRDFPIVFAHYVLGVLSCQVKCLLRGKYSLGSTILISTNTESW